MDFVAAQMKSYYIFGYDGSLKINKIFGLDFMIDENFKVYLIEVNTNPCYELSSTLLSRLIPQMIENAIR